MIAAEGDEVTVSGLLEPLQTPRHRVGVRRGKSPLKPKEGLSGPPVMEEMVGQPPLANALQPENMAP